MTELERMLKTTLTALEKEVTVTQETHGKRLAAQQESLKAQAQHIQELRRNIEQLRAGQQESAQHLQRLSDIHANLEPLLSRLSALLNAK